ncbi:MAG: hypothetical protein Q9163_001409 [Psora crenata]
MATTSDNPVNGNYGAHQPHNLADVPQPAQGQDLSQGNAQFGEGNHAATSSSAPAAEEDKPIPKEMIGWYFVEQYYNTMSKSPDRLHLYYTKKSQFVAGDETQKVPVAVGQQNIGERIKELDIQDCKVRVTNVDSQESAKGILVQVIGEMSNRAAPHRKFVQTFVLAEQPTGYYVLNDIFRYIVEEEEEELENGVPNEEIVTTLPTESAPAALTSSHDTVQQEHNLEEVDRKLEADVPNEPVTDQKPATVDFNDVPAPVETPAAEQPEDASAAAADVATSEAPEQAVESAAVDDIVQPEKPRDPDPTPIASSPKPAKAAPTGPPKPAAPQTWAERLAASKGSNTVATPNGAKAVPPATPAALKPKTGNPSTKESMTPPTSTGEETPVNPQQNGAAGWQMAGSDNKQRQGRQPSQSVPSNQGNVLGYVKNVTDKVDASILKTVLAGFGRLEYFDVSRQKNCAFVEFADAAAYNAAVAANPHNIGGEQIFVEERRPRANAYGANFTGRGGMRGGRPNDRPGSQGRGGFNKDGSRGGGYAPRGRATSIPLVSSTPMSFRMATEEMLDKESREASATGSDSSYGVQSLEDTIHNASSDLSDTGNPIREDSEESDKVGGRRRSTLKSRSRQGNTVIGSQLQTANSSPRPGQPSPPPSMSHSMTSLSFDSQAPLSSFPSSPKSFSNRSSRPSDEDSVDEAGSQAIVSSSEDDAGPSSNLQDSAPQLIMPSIKMPSRRPFTDRGKCMGRLKILIAGDSGVGKTSLIKSIVQICEDIVHVDPLSISPPALDQAPLKKIRTKQYLPNSKSTQLITEVYASTKPYPSWWLDIEDNKVLKKCKNVGETVLERNLCFVDTPGYSSGMSKIEAIDSVLQYIEGQLNKSFTASSSSAGEFVGLLSGDGGSQVDVVFYMISQDIKHEDVTFLHRLASLTNVIVLLAKSDAMSNEETEVLRRSISDSLSAARVRTYQFRTEDARQPPFTVCAALSDDNDNMDASILMSPDYMRPLVASELGLLIQQIFDKDTVSCLRHLAATKLVQSQRGSKAWALPPSIPPAASHWMSNQRPASSESPSSITLRTMTTQAGAKISPYALARIVDHTQQEEKLAQIRLAKWAADLQRTLQNERSRYECLARGEQAVWLSEQLQQLTDKDVSATLKIMTLSRRSDRNHRRRRSGITYQYGFMDADDPLGLLQWNELMRRKGWIALQVAGGFGILGAVAVYVARSWSLGDNGVGDWSWNWCRGRADDIIR